MGGEPVYYWPRGSTGTFFLDPYYLVLPPGTYDITAYFMLTNNCNRVVGVLEAVNLIGNVTYAEKPITCNALTPGSWVRIPLTISIDNYSQNPVMIRSVNMSGVAELYFGGIVVDQVDS